MSSASYTSIVQQEVTHWQWVPKAGTTAEDKSRRLLRSRITIASLIQEAPRLQREPGFHLFFLPRIEKNFTPKVSPELAQKLAATLFLPDWFFDHIGWNANGFFGSKVNPIVDPGQNSYSTYLRFLTKDVFPKKDDVRLHDDLDPSSNMNGLEIGYQWSFMGFGSFWRAGNAESLNSPDTRSEGVGSIDSSEQISEASTSNRESSSSDTLNDHGLTRDVGSVMLVCFDLTRQAEHRVEQEFLKADLVSLFASPHSVLDHVSWAVVREFDRAVWGFQPLVRFVERTRFEFAQDDKIDLPTLNERYEFIHELSRHVLHITETMNVAARTLAAIAGDYKTAGFQTRPDDQLTRDLKLCSNFMENIQSRGQAFIERLHNEAQVAFNVVSAYDAKVSTNILEQTRNESKSLTDTVTVLTLLFLPGTFVSGFFGMNFFTLNVDDTGGSRWKFTPMFWIFFACTTPLTILGFILFTLEVNLILWTKEKVTKPLKETMARLVTGRGS